MPKNILIDINILLDYLLERKHYEESVTVLKRGIDGDERHFISAHTLPTLAYVLESYKVPARDIKIQIRWTLTYFSVVANDEELLLLATDSRVADYEDAVIEQAALRAGCSVIVTRNDKDFTRSKVPAVAHGSYLVGGHL